MITNSPKKIQRAKKSLTQKSEFSLRKDHGAPSAKKQKRRKNPFRVAKNHSIQSLSILSQIEEELLIKLSWTEQTYRNKQLQQIYSTTTNQAAKMAAIEDDISMIGYEESDFEVESDDDNDDDNFMMVDEENKKSMAPKSTKGKKAASSNKSKKNPILSPRTEGAGNVPKSSATISTTAKGATKNNNKKKTVEETYQKKSQLEHILLRPDTYVGSVEPLTEQMFIYDEVQDAIINKTITYTPGLYKIFDESKF